MNDYSIAEQEPDTRGSQRLKTSLSRRLAQRFLKTVRYGQIELHEDGQSSYFGSLDTRPDLDAIIHAHDPRAYSHIVKYGVLGAGEAYILGWWSSPNLVKVIRVFSANMHSMQAMGQRGRVRKLTKDLLQIGFSRNSMPGSKKNIIAHYDLSNAFFASFLDASMMYSSAIFPSPAATLDEAAEFKLRHICERLQLSADDHVLEIGTGWGGLACYAAEHYGCRVTTTTISNEQYSFAKNRVHEQGLQHLVTVLDKDYRDLEGAYDKLVSVEMIEAVGHQYYSQFFSKCDSLLKEDGAMLLQAINIVDQRYEQAKRSIDFIKKYIFPGGCLPSNAVIAQEFAHSTDMQIIGLEDIGMHYAQTLAHWRTRFESAEHRLQEFGFDDRFKRMWEYYLCYCEGGFRERIISAVQVLAIKPHSLLAPPV